MKCVYCKTGDTRVVETGKLEKSVIRRRVCNECGGVFLTEELGYGFLSKNHNQLMKELRKVR